MLVTDFAYRDMEARSNGMADRVAQFVRWLLRRPAPTISLPDSPVQVAPEEKAHTLARPPSLEGNVNAEPLRLEAIETFRWRRHPQLLNRSEAGATTDVEDLERSARSSGVRGLFLARSGQTDEARVAFATAASELSVDLAAIPGFWTLSRAGMLAAVAAYNDVERYRDAAALGARIRLTYRPRSVSAVPAGPVQRRSTGGS